MLYKPNCAGVVVRLRVGASPGLAEDLGRAVDQKAIGSSILREDKAGCI